MKNYSSKISLSNISILNPNEIFVFGSNESNIHGGGTALFACKNFGAIYKYHTDGLHGQSYAIPTKDKKK
jgi:hypothetical protein